MKILKKYFEIYCLIFLTSGCATFSDRPSADSCQFSMIENSIGVEFENYFGYINSDKHFRISMAESVENIYRKSLESSFNIRFAEFSNSQEHVRIKLTHWYEPIENTNAMWVMASAATLFIIPSYVDGIIDVQAEVLSADGTVKKKYNRNIKYTQWNSIVLLPSLLINFNSLEGQRIALRSSMINLVMNDFCKDDKSLRKNQ